MTIGTLTLLSLTGSLLLLKLALMALALILLAQALFSPRQAITPIPTLARLALPYKP
jgi:hypothetical protein